MIKLMGLILLASLSLSAQPNHKKLSKNYSCILTPRIHDSRPLFIYDITSKELNAIKLEATEMGECIQLAENKAKQLNQISRYNDYVFSFVVTFKHKTKEPTEMKASIKFRNSLPRTSRIPGEFHVDNQMKFYLEDNDLLQYIYERIVEVEQFTN